MLQQVRDMREEAEALHEFVRTLDESVWQRPTPFHGWTLFDVLGHLHFFDLVALQSLTSDQAFTEIADELVKAMLEGVELSAFTRKWLGPRKPAELLGRWHRSCLEMCERLERTDPERRLKWFGPDMGVRMFTTARQMETWAHGQAVYDLLRVPRVNTDRIKNIVVIGIKTFGWSFMNRGLMPPAEAPQVRVTAPSGAVWQWNESNRQNRVQGSAVDFCLVVTRSRNLADTDLEITGEDARQWMSIAQCFAGGPVDAPRPGERAWEREPR
jgi:uncharacterized protein (TIGR03084 family)